MARLEAGSQNSKEKTRRVPKLEANLREAAEEKLGLIDDAAFVDWLFSGKSVNGPDSPLCRDFPDTDLILSEHINLGSDYPTTEIDFIFTEEGLRMRTRHRKLVGLSIEETVSPLMPPNQDMLRGWLRFLRKVPLKNAMVGRPIFGTMFKMEFLNQS